MGASYREGWHSVKISHDYPGAFEQDLQMSDELYKWLNSNAHGWDWISCPVESFIIIEVMTADQALMLKLAWGGQ